MYTAFFLREASKKINCMRDQTIFYDTVYCPLMPTAFSPHYVSSNAQWKNYLIFVIFKIHLVSSGISSQSVQNILVLSLLRFIEMTFELITFNHLRGHSSSTALGTRTGY